MGERRGEAWLEQDLHSGCSLSLEAPVGIGLAVQVGGIACGQRTDSCTRRDSGLWSPDSQA